MTLLSEPLPLRRTTILGAFAEAGFIAHRYGTCSGRLQQYDATLRVWIWADHYVQSIDVVTVQGVAVTDFELLNTVDATGHPVALVVFGQPQDPSTVMIATGRAKPFTNPADIVFDILSAIAGRAVTPAQFSEFRADCDRLQIIAGGSVETNDSAQTQARSVCESVGAIFCGDGPQLCRIWPEGATGVPRLTVTRRHGLTARADLGDIANALTVEFAHADGEARQSLQFEAPASIANPAIGRRPYTLSAPWLQDARVASDVGTRLLRLLARPQWKCSISGIRKRLNTGDTLTLDHPRLPIAGPILLQDAAYDTGTGLCTASAIVPAGQAPEVVFVGQSGAFVPPNAPGVTVETVGSDRKLFIFGPGRVGLAGASVTIDGSAPRLTDAAGFVYFPVSMVPPGRHVLVATKDGFNPQTAEIET